MSNPDVSLVMAAFAPQPAWLKAAVDSALRQAGCNSEVIVVDDGSPEPVARMLSSDRVRVIRTRHRGLGAARTVGIDESRGRYLRFIDADDVYPHRSTAALLGVAQGRQDVVACGTTRWCGSDLEPIFDWRVTWRGDPLRALLLMRTTITPPGSMLVPRALAESIGPWRSDLAIAQDWDYQLRLLEAGQLASTPEVVTWYRQHTDSLSRDARTGWNDCAAIVGAYFARNPAQRGTRLERQAYAGLDLLAAELENSPHGPWGNRRFWAALRRDPAALGLVYERLAQPRLARLKMRLRRGVGRG